MTREASDRERAGREESRAKQEPERAGLCRTRKEITLHSCYKGNGLEVYFGFFYGILFRSCIIFTIIFPMIKYSHALRMTFMFEKLFYAQGYYQLAPKYYYFVDKCVLLLKQGEDFSSVTIRVNSSRRAQLKSL